MILPYVQSQTLICQDQFAQLLSPLAELRTLQVHLDLTSTPIPTFYMRHMERYGMGSDYDPESLDAFAHDQHMVAEVCARIVLEGVRCGADEAK